MVGAFHWKLLACGASLVASFPAHASQGTTSRIMALPRAILRSTARVTSKVLGSIFFQQVGSFASMSAVQGGASGPGTNMDLDNIYLKRIISETEVDSKKIKAKSLWADNGAIIMVVRRPGCQLCREEALDLTLDLLPELAEPKPRLVAVVAETTSVEPFIQEYFEGGEVYLDEDRAFMKALGDRWLGVQGLLYPSVWKNGARSQKKYPNLKGDLKGEGRRLGGLLVISPAGSIVFEHKEGVFGDHADMKKVESAIKTMQQQCKKDKD